jgi:hypothetical protein
MSLVALQAGDEIAGLRAVRAVIDGLAHVCEGDVGESGRS